MKYSVTIQFIGSTTIEVDAEDEDAAMNAALDQAPQNDFAYCDYDPGEWYVDDDSQFPSIHLIEDTA